MQDPSEETAFETLRDYASRFVRLAQDVMRRLSETTLRAIAIGFTTMAMLFPPWAGYINRNGVSAKLDGGHHFLLNGPNLFEIDYKKLTLYILLIWLFYGTLRILGKASKN